MARLARKLGYELSENQTGRTKAGRGLQPPQEPLKIGPMHQT